MKNNKNTLLRMTVLAAGMLSASLSMAADTFKVGMEITYPPFES